MADPAGGDHSAEDLAAMRIALEEAASGAAEGEVPVGAVALVAGRVVARRHNQRELSQDPTAHAELLALKDAAMDFGSWRLSEVTLAATLEPCPMCAGALLAARVPRLVFGAFDPKAGACGSLYNLCVDPRFNHQLEVVPGVLADESTKILEDFFSAMRGSD